MVSRSRSQMFLTFVSPPEDQDTKVTFPNSVYGKNESTVDAGANSNVQYIRGHLSEGWLYDFEKPKRARRRRSVTTSYRPWRSRCERVKRQLFGKWPRGLPHLSELLFCACVRAGANLRPNLETTSGEQIPCPDLSLRSGRKNLGRWIFRSWKLSGPTFVSTCSVHRSYCRRVLYILISMAYIGVP